ncbi:chemotaxis-specific protein-glutamate methyltransferase CheB [Pseudochelatococcus sp. B33]
MAGRPDDIRVMVVDDSAVIRGLTARWLGEVPGIEVVAVHANGRMAVEDVTASQPDVVILDIEMPEMDGLTALPLLLQRRPGLVVLVSSTLSRRGAEISLRALTLGAADCIAKPDGSGRIASAADYRRELVELVAQLGGQAKRRRAAVPAAPPASAAPAPEPRREAAFPPARADAPARDVQAGRSSDARPAPAKRPAGNGPPLRPFSSVPPLRPFSSVPPRVLALGSSTGGPQALVQVLTACKDALVRVPVLIVQHMPPTFTALLAEQLGRATGLPSAEAKDGEEVLAGHIYVAPGGLHLVIEKEERSVVTRLRDTPPEHFCRPAVDPLFRSVAQVFGAASLAVVLTGMGNDGSLGASAISGGGGSVVIQDEETSVVWGMPGAVRAAGAAAAVLPLARIGLKLGELLRGSGR